MTDALDDDDLDADLYVVVTDREGATHRLAAVTGWRLMEVIREHGLPIKAECGGACACATCHVYVGEEWLSKIPDQTDEEIEKLDEAFEVEDNSRLSCQIILDESHDGLTATLAPSDD